MRAARPCFILGQRSEKYSRTLSGARRRLFGVSPATCPLRQDLMALEVHRLFKCVELDPQRRRSDDSTLDELHLSVVL